MVFHWSVSDSKSPQVSRTLLSIMTVLNNVVVWMVLTRSLISKSSSHFNSPLVTVLNAPITIGIIVTFMFYSFFNSLARYLSFFSHSFSFILWSAGTAKSTILQVLFLLLIIIWSGLWPRFRWSVCMSKSHRSLCVSFSRTGAGLCICHLFVWSNFNFLHIFQWIPLPTQSCLVLYSFCDNLLHSLIMWLMVSSLPPYSWHLLFCCVLSILTFIWLILMALFCAVIRRDSVSLLRFPFLSHVKVLSCEMLFISRLKRPWSCFPSLFCFLVIVILLSIMLSLSFLVPVISPPSSRCIDASTLSSMLTSPLPHSFLETYNLSTSSLKCNALCIVISFFFCSVVHLFKFVSGPLEKGSGISNEWYSPGIHSLIRSLLESFVSSSVLVLLRYSFWMLSFISTCLMVSSSKMPKYL